MPATRSACSCRQKASEKLLAASEVADLLRVNPATVWRYVKRGTLPAPIKIHGRTWWIEAEVMGAIEGKKADRPLPQEIRIHERDFVESLIEENRQLKEKIAELSGSCMVERAREVFKLGEKPAKLLALLAKRGTITRRQAIEACYEDAEIDRMEDSYQSIQQRLRDVRRALEPRGIIIERVYGTGWRVNPNTLSVLRAALEG